jgi:hypothetical protein
MLRESHTTRKPQQAIFSLLTLLAVWLALAILSADAFNFGRHRKVDNNEAGGQAATDATASSSSASSSSASSSAPTNATTSSTAAADPAASNPAGRSPAAAAPGRNSPAGQSVPAGQSGPAGQSSPAQSNPAGTKQEQQQAAAAVKAPAVTIHQALPLTASPDKSATTIGKAPLVQSKNPQIIHRKDFSGRFSFVLPEGWRTYQIPYQAHDVLSLRESDSIMATITFADQPRKKNLEKLKDETIETNKKQMQKYQLIESKIMALPGGQPCARIVSLAQIDEINTRQVQFIVDLKKKHFIAVTLTVTKPVGEKYDKLLQEVVTSLSTNPDPAKTTK